MAAEAIIAAMIGAAGGTGGARLWRAMSPRRRDESITRYYRGVIKDLQKENRDLRKTVRGLNGELTELGERVHLLELAHDAPPPHLG